MVSLHIYVRTCVFMKMHRKKVWMDLHTEKQRNYPQGPEWGRRVEGVKRALFFMKKPLLFMLLNCQKVLRVYVTNVI